MIDHCDLKIKVMASQGNTGISKELSTFIKWRKEDIIRYKTIEVGNKTYVTFI